MGFLLLLVLLSIGGLILFNASLRAKQVRALMERGTTITGILIAKRKPVAKGKRRFILSYEYTTSDATHKGRAVVSRSVFSQYEIGQALPLRYLDDRPAVSAPEFVIQKMRETLSKAGS